MYLIHNMLDHAIFQLVITYLALELLSYQHLIPASIPALESSNTKHDEGSIPSFLAVVRNT